MTTPNLEDLLRSGQERLAALQPSRWQRFVSFLKGLWPQKEKPFSVYDIMGAQPMTGKGGEVFALRSTYGQPKPPMSEKEYNDQRLYDVMAKYSAIAAEKRAEEEKKANLEKYGSEFAPVIISMVKRPAGFSAKGIEMGLKKGKQPDQAQPPIEELLGLSALDEWAATNNKMDPK
jgi:hypothetical protein